MHTHLEVDTFVVLSVVVDGPGGDEAIRVSGDQITARLKLHREDRPR